MNNSAIKRSLALLLVFIFAAFQLIACSPEAPEVPNEPEITTLAPETTTDASTTEEPEPIDFFLDLVADSKSKFNLVRPQGASHELIDIIIDFRSNFEKKTGIALDIIYEKEVVPSDTYEIIIGKSNSADFKEIYDQLKSNDYFFGISGNKLMIAGGSDAALKNACQYFFRKFLDTKVSKDKANIRFSIEDNYLEKGVYPISDLTVGNVPLSKVQIVYSENDIHGAEIFARRVADSIYMKAGVKVPVVTDAAPATEAELVVGITNRNAPPTQKESYSITYKDNRMFFNCDYSEGYNLLYEHVKSNVIVSRKNLSLNEEFNITTPLSTVFKNGSENALKKSGNIRILIHNIYGGNSAEIPAYWRMEQLKDVYRDYAPDIIGLQEYSDSVKPYMSKHLEALGYVEVPYHTKNQNLVVRTPLFYNPDTLKLIDSGYWRYNDNSGDTSKSVGWGLFEEKATQKRFIAGGTHFYWTGDELGKSARIIDATELAELMISLSNKHNVPVIVGGDYNCKLESDPLNILLKDNKFVEAEDIAIKTEFGGSHHSYPTFDNNTGIAHKYYPASGTYKSAIDHIFVYNESKLTVNMYDVIEDFFALASSDHCPLITDFTLK